MKGGEQLKIKWHPQVVVKINSFSNCHPILTKFVWPFVVALIIPFIVVYLMH